MQVIKQFDCSKILIARGLAVCSFPHHGCISESCESCLIHKLIVVLSFDWWMTACGRHLCNDMKCADTFVYAERPFRSRGEGQGEKVAMLVSQKKGYQFRKEGSRHILECLNLVRILVCTIAECILMKGCFRVADEMFVVVFKRFRKLNIQASSSRAHRPLL